VPKRRLTSVHLIVLAWFADHPLGCAEERPPNSAGRWRHWWRSAGPPRGGGWSTGRRCS